VLTIPGSDAILEKLENIHEKCKENKDISENKLKRYFHKSGILEKLGYDEDDVHVEETVKDQKRTDIHVTDDYGNVRAVIEFKKPTVQNLGEHFDQLWNRYMKPLKAKYGLLYNGFELYFYERIRNNYDKKFGKNVLGLERKNVSTIVQNIKKPKYDLTQIGVVSDYLKEFEDPEEKLNLKDEASREHFFENFKLNKNSSFGDLLSATIDLFNEMESKGEFGFMKSAYDFWKMSYAKKPDTVPKNWKPIMEECGLSDKQEDLYKFMFCLETTYALFTRLILAKSAEDYEFADIKFVGFIETEIERASFRGDIPRASWAKITQDLVSDMRDKLVSSVFEEDIFYWWTEPYEGRSFRDFFRLSDEELTYAMDEFGEKIRKILLTFCKFDFSEIKGDPLGILYQRYFDKDTRKALGEFYTPQEVVDYILDSVDYEGRKVLDKRLLDPACGSGTFLVTALKRYLEASEDVAEDKGWDWVLDNLCNNYRIVGFDIHPFATIMAQIQFMLVLLPYYKRAIEDDPRFVLKRVPIFRTDSLVDESETGDITLKDFENGKRFSMKVQLPVEGEEGEFFEESFLMPHSGTVLRNTDIYNNEEYFGALQGLFDVVKEQAEDMDDDKIPEFDEERFETILKKHYLSDKDWNQISSFFRTFGNELIEKIYELQTEFDDGRLIKSIEDIFLAALLKNEQRYDYVVGNPPYVRQEIVAGKDQLEINYPDVYQGRADLYVYFMRRALDWINNEGTYGYITSGKFTKTNYGKYLRAQMVTQGNIRELIDFRGISVFEDATNDPVIVIQDNNSNTFGVKVSFKDPKKDISTIISEIKNDNDKDYMVSFSFENSYLTEKIKKTTQDKKYIETFNILPPRALELVEKLKRFNRLDKYFEVYRGIRTGRNSVYITKKGRFNGNSLKPILEGKEVERYYTFKKNKEIIYATQDIFDPDENSDIMDYLKKNEEILKTRAQYQNRKSKGENIKWWEIEQPLSPELFEQKKIVTQRITQNYRFSLEDQMNYTLETCTTLIPKNIKNNELYYFLGILNSTVLEFFAKADGKSLGESGYELEKQFVERFPIKKVKNNQIIDNVKEIIFLRKLDYKTSNLKEYTNAKEVNKSKLRMEFNHSNISPSIQKTQDDMYGVIIGKRKKEEPIVVETKEKAEFIKLTLAGESVKKNEKIEVLVPKSNYEVKQILQEYEEDKENLEEMPTIEKLEEEINEMVYELYGLDDDDIEVIEEFLEKF